MSIVSVIDLHHVALAVPDLESERRFFGGTWGLQEVAEQDGKVYFAAVESAHPYVIRLRQDAEKKTDLLGFLAASNADVDAIYAELKPKLDLLPKRDVRGPVDRPYGMRELMVLGPDGNFIVFAQPVDSIMLGHNHERATYLRSLLIVFALRPAACQRLHQHPFGNIAGSCARQAQRS